MNKYSLDEPIAAIATSLNPSALAIIRTSGKGCIDLASKVFSKPAKLRSCLGNSILHGWVIQGENGIYDQKKIDEVTVCVYRAPKSFTGEDCVEFICHGGVAIVLRIYKLLLQNGFRQAYGGEFTFRAFMNGKTDLTKAEAINEIINSKTDKSLTLAAERLSGALFSKIEAIKNELIAIIAAADVEIEYPEDEHTTKHAFLPHSIIELIGRVQKLSESWEYEKIFIEGAKVVLAGKTNVGKSSLFNALLKEDRAIVSDIHGTTRDLLEAALNFNGIPVNLYDTAGIRYSQDKVETLGIKRSLDISRACSLILYLCSSEDILALNSLSNDDLDFIKNAKVPLIAVITKEDLLSTDEKEKIKSILKNTGRIDEFIMLSSKTSSGLKELSDLAYNVLCNSSGREQDFQGAAVGSLRQKNVLDKCLNTLCTSYKHAFENFPLDMIIEDLQEALTYLEEVTGEVSSEDILDKVFSGFCVGK